MSEKKNCVHLFWMHEMFLIQIEFKVFSIVIEKNKFCKHSTRIPILCGYFWQLFRFQFSCEQKASSFLVSTNVCALLHTLRWFNMGFASNVA